MPSGHFPLPFLTEGYQPKRDSGVHPTIVLRQNQRKFQAYYLYTVASDKVIMFFQSGFQLDS